MPVDEIRIDAHEIEELAQRYATAANLAEEMTRRNLDTLGRRLRYTMRQQLREHRYMGDLEESVSYVVSGTRLEVGPTAKRGRWDAGAILQQGTRPISRLPFEPIRRWAEFRGLPAGPVWYKLKTQGAAAHPFVNETLQRGDSQVAIQNTARRIAQMLMTKAMTGEELLGGENVE
jgi:hypothetical protein